MTKTAQIAIVYHSGYGHTEVLAHSVAKGALEAGAEVEMVSVEDLEKVDWDLLARADALIFGSPTYMGSVSGPFKCFMDASSKIWAERGWQNKVAAGFTVSASQSGDKLQTLMQMSLLAAQHGMIWAGLNLMPGNNSSTGSVDDLNRLGSFLGLMAQANADQGADVTPPAADKRTGEVFGERVVQVTRQWKAGAQE